MSRRLSSPESQQGGKLRAMEKSISRITIIGVTQDQVSANLTSDFEGESVILDLKDGVYYELNEVAARVWELIQEPASVQNVLDTLVAEYDVTLGECEADVVTLLEDMVLRGLVETRDERTP